MFDAVAEFISMQQGDSAEFIEKARAIALALLRNMSLRASTSSGLTTVWAEVDALCGKIHCRKRRCHRRS